MEYSRVSSGYTKVIDEQRRDWYEKLGEEKLEWEDLAGAESTNDLLRMLGNVPLPISCELSAVRMGGKRFRRDPVRNSSQ